MFTKSLDIFLAVAHVAEFLKPAHWFKQIKRTVSFDATTRFNPIQQSTAAYNSHLFNGRNTTIDDQLSYSKYTEVLLLSLCKAYFYINHMYSKSSHCNLLQKRMFFPLI